MRNRGHRAVLSSVAGADSHGRANRLTGVKAHRTLVPIGQADTTAESLPAGAPALKPHGHVATAPWQIKGDRADISPIDVEANDPRRGALGGGDGRRHRVGGPSRRRTVQSCRREGGDHDYRTKSAHVFLPLAA